MLSRSAQSLYWLGRYLERAGNLSRLLQLQSESLVDRPVREIHFGWNRVYNYVRREPPGGEVSVGDGFDDEDFVLADSFALADDLTFERSNPSSVFSCFAQGRERTPATPATASAPKSGPASTTPTCASRNRTSPPSGNGNPPPSTNPS